MAVAAWIQGKIIVGHSLWTDLQVSALSEVEASQADECFLGRA